MWLASLRPALLGHRSQICWRATLRRGRAAAATENPAFRGMPRGRRGGRKGVRRLQLTISGDYQEIRWRPTNLKGGCLPVCYGGVCDASRCPTALCVIHGKKRQ
jgi:hypothetical protein